MNDRGTGIAIWIIVFLMIAVIVGVAYREFFMPAVAQPQPVLCITQENINELEQTFDSLIADILDPGVNTELKKKLTEHLYDNLLILKCNADIYVSSAHSNGVELLADNQKGIALIRACITKLGKKLNAATGIDTSLFVIE